MVSARATAWAGTATLVIAFALSLAIGRYPLDAATALAVIAAKLAPIKPWWPPIAESIVFDLRLPRIGAALLVGAALSASGAAYQSVFRNPMASPDILGVAAGASFGAGCGILLNWNVAAIEASAFALGLAAAGGTTLAGALRKGGDSALTMILAGIFIGSLFSSALAILKLAADPANVLPAITFWLMGSLANIDVRELALAAPPILVGFALVWALRWRLDALTLGDDEALALGVNAPRLRLCIVIGATLMTSACVSIAGIIGLVGLVVPHLVRPFCGPSARKLIPLSALTGGVFLLLVDDFSRTISSVELPIGVLTSLIGAPVFLYLLSTIARKGF
ncbi:iron complex transport system permease protein [Rhodoblastus acidophilus]|uniref:Iron complex transport system permease protein n=1 Tax=Rhodoblastus acidophilus TaxID=1074 RepID=A0A212SDV7_RHOAC|nr:iron ABC transporter permease [Rhodoblastus acidophilus]PPQ35180.1 iron ABC transporter permease [Rhodoblastus acidophilus]RAI16918.1 iron ABC transporter permease [Rhodoblastus acidophilus]SNB83623.1 iron complex transport system permease protein [Rhodoblastus acidophilus]